MIAERIKILPFQIERIMECEIVKKVNEHGRAYIKGYISSEEEKKYLALASSEPTVQIEAVSEEGECAVIFSGLMKDCRIRNRNQVLTMELSLVTHTWLMDLRPSIRSFQTPGMPYQQLFDTIAGSYSGGGCMMSEGGARVTEDLIVQYQETDWEFFKRLASHLNTVVVPSYRTNGVKCYTGLPQWSGLTKVSPVSYTACKLVSDYLYKQQNQVQGLIEEDELCFEIQDLHVFDLGEQVEFQGRTYYVTECRSHLDGHQLWNTYLIKTKSGIRVPQTYNEKMVGASLDGTISGVAGAKVKVRLTPDVGGGNGKWFPFSTVYSSPDGSGLLFCGPVGEPRAPCRRYRRAVCRRRNHRHSMRVGCRRREKSVAGMYLRRRCGFCRWQHLCGGRIPGYGKPQRIASTSISTITPLGSSRTATAERAG